MEALGPLVSEQLGLERVPMEVSHENGTHRIKVGDDGEVEVQEDLTSARATKSHLSGFGIDFAFEGGSGFANPFSWAA